MLDAYVFSIMSPRNNKVAPCLNFFGVGLYCCDVLESRRNSLKCQNQGTKTKTVHTYTEQNSPISDKKNWVPKSKFGYVKTALNVKIQYQSLHLRRKKMKNPFENKRNSNGNQKFTVIVYFLPLLQFLICVL